MRITVRVTARAANEGVGPFDGTGQLAVRVTAPPADGAANAAVTRLLAKALDLPARDIVLVTGTSSRTKTFDIPLEAAELAARLGNQKR